MDSNIKTSPLSRFWLLLKPDRSEIRNVYIYSIFNGLVNLSVPIGIQAIINLIQGGQVNTSWFVLLFLVILGVALTGILQISQLRITENLQQKIFTRAAFEFAYRIPRLDLMSLRNHYAPELTNRFFDIVSVQKGLSKIIIDFSAAGIQVVFGLILLSLYHPFFILFSIILVLLVYTIFKLTAKQGLVSSLEESKHKYKIAHWLQEMARANTTFKLASNSLLAMDKTNSQAAKYVSARESHFKILVKQYGLMVSFKVMITAGLLAMGGLLVMDQQMNIGQFVAAELIILLVLSSVEKLILSLETVYDVLTSLEKIGQVTDMPLDQKDGTGIILQNQNGIALKVNDLVFSYPHQNYPTINKLSFELAPKAKVWVSGENGSGKSTLISLLAGLFPQDSGQIVYNNIPLQDIDRCSLHELSGFYLSTDELFEGTIIDNITLGRNISFEQLIWACKQLELDDFIQQQKQAYHTIIKPQGQLFPRSIIEKLLLARAIVSNPSLLLIEDVFTNINEEERERIARFLFQPEQNWTLILTSKDSIFKKYAGQHIHLKTNKDA